MEVKGVERARQCVAFKAFNLETFIDVRNSNIIKWGWIDRVTLPCGIIQIYRESL
jgi:hypothetical protein